MTTVRDILENLSELAPTQNALGFDNVGLLAGSGDGAVRRVLVSLDITLGVIDEARDFGAELIVSHHPLIFGALKTVTDSDVTGRRVRRLISSGISAICMHTNLDAAASGVNDALADALGLRVLDILNKTEGVSRLCSLDGKESFPDFLARVKKNLHANGLRYVDCGKDVSLVGICGGAGAGDMKLAADMGCDTFVTADVKHHEFLDAAELGINLIDAGHFSTENVVVPVLAKRLGLAFPEVETRISAVHAQPEKFFVC